ncbi:hypothetical protein MSAN_01358100 [Mycena sanguinolenta]|uniref:Uncharacterized protein n=1 Tax=Mycena sanguinolenta TaxID=230812 RepID=A0A8H6YED8_9AGAR|nr:hypothetical protein MSAN_01358100 [Mycena sanguinolenta]
MSIQMSFVPMTTNINPTMLEEVLTVAPLLRSLRFPALPPSLVRQLAQGRFNNFEELFLGRIDNTNHTPLIFTVPRLRKFSAGTIRETQILVPWSQLTELTFDCGSSDVILEVLSQYRQDISVRFSHSCSLELSFRADFASIFDHLSTPVLQELLLELGEGTHWTQAHLTAFQLRAPNITQLEIALTGCWSFISDNLVAAVHNSPSLTHLKLIFCDDCFNDCFDDAFIRALHYEDGVTPLVPRLHHLSAWNAWNGEVNFTGEILAGMIASRWWSDAELASYGAPPAVARWTYVEFDMGFHEWGPHFADILKDIPSDVLTY